MSDFLDCCKTTRAERDDARLEADRLRGEVARLAKERDDALAVIRRLNTPPAARDPLATIVRHVAARWTTRDTAGRRGPAIHTDR